MRISDWSSDVCSSDLVRKERVPCLRLAPGAKVLDGRYAGPERVPRKWKRRGQSAEFSCRFSTQRANGDDVEHPRMHVKVEVAVKGPVAGGVRRQIEADFCTRQNIDGMLHRVTPGMTVHHLEEMTIQMNRRSEKRRVGKECVSTCSTRVSPSN